MFLYNQPFPWTYKNHLSFGYHKDSSGRVNKNMFFSKVGSVNRPASTVLEEAQIACKLIHKAAEKNGQEIFLCLSGGIDSESMLRAFLFSAVPFHGVIMRFNDDLNDFDIKNIIQFCETNHMSYEVFDVDIFEFFESGKHLQYGKMYQCQSPQLAVHLYLCDHINGCPVFSWQAPEIFFKLDLKNKTKLVSFGVPGDLHLVYLRYFMKKERPGVPFFFLYTPELLKSFFQLPLLQKMIWLGYYKGFDVYPSYDIKCMAYKRAGFPVKPRKAPYTGFEKVKDHYDLLDKKSYGLAFNERYRIPLEILNPLPEKFYQIAPKNMFSDLEQIQKWEEMYEKQFFKSDFNPNLLFKEEMDEFYENKGL
ncbi:MAG: hypothetical protein OXN83_05120 [Oligoflexia bacterium]|nr:hypothetical protein [Oligoflexia bacterium]